MPRVEVEFRCESLCREFDLLQVRIKSLRIQKDGVTANGLHDRDVPIGEQFAEIKHLTNARADVLVLDRFFDADCKRFEVATCKSAVGVQTFVHDDEVAQFLEQMSSR